VSDVIVTETNVDTPVTLHTAPVGTPLPTDLADLDPQQWSTVPTFLADNCGTDDPRLRRSGRRDDPRR
jgi:hypothetical protein